MAKETLKCHGKDCGQEFPRKVMVKYATLNAKTAYWYCPECLKKVQENEWFANEICRIFGTKRPGQQVYAERKRLKEEYGYTDKTIIDCLNYVYDVERIKKVKATLYFVKPDIIEKMMKYKRTNDNIGNNLAQAAAIKYEEYIVPEHKVAEKKKEFLNPDDFLED